MTFATDMQAVALDLLSELGQAITISRSTSTDYNPSTGGVDPVTSTIYTGYGQPRDYRLSEIDGTIIQAGDINLLVYIATEPEIGDTVEMDSISYRVMAVTKVKAQGSNIVYRLQLRK